MDSPVERVHYLPVVMRKYTGEIEPIGWYFFDDKWYTTRQGPFDTKQQALSALAERAND